MQSDSTQPPEPDLRLTYDAVVVGSGAAGGMAAHVLTSHGMKVLLLEAGRKLPIEKELKVDGVALRSSAPWRNAARQPGARPQRIQHPQSSLCQGFRLPARVFLRAGREQLGLFEEHRG